MLDDDEKLGVAVYKDDPESPHDYFTTRFRDGAFEVVADGRESPSVDGKVSTEYLEKLANDADEYVEAPLNMDLDLITFRLGFA